ncbi:hypothetical protein Cni_G04259 [Canna indica]|uniref:Uncharacterized protein n=1 Tax=Canna indica TaxID=4628 RepID=A0AAQ3JV39_9LILI|nr:hypothetical protein Cni_G04259 [Canna indica]
MCPFYCSRVHRRKMNHPQAAAVCPVVEAADELSHDGVYGLLRVAAEKRNGTGITRTGKDDTPVWHKGKPRCPGIHLPHHRSTGT